MGETQTKMVSEREKASGKVSFIKKFEKEIDTPYNDTRSKSVSTV